VVAEIKPTAKHYRIHTNAYIFYYHNF
jgi:hypothetical protein